MTNSTQTTNLFEIAVRNRYRFAYKGTISVEDLFELSLEALDTIFKNLNKELKQVSEESLLTVKTAEDKLVENKIAIVKLIVEEKLKAIEDMKNAHAQKANDQKILAILAARQEADLANKSDEELQALLSTNN